MVMSIRKLLRYIFKRCHGIKGVMMFALTAMSLMLFIGTAYAVDDTASTTLIDNRQWAVISGKTNLPFEYVTIQIYNPVFEGTETFANIDQTLSKADRTYRHMLPLPVTGSGTYRVRLVFENGTENVLFFERVEISKIEEAFETLKASASIATVQGTLEQYGQFLGLDLFLYGGLSSSAKTEAVKKLIYYRDEVSAFSDVVQLNDILYEAVAVQRFIGAGSAAEIENLFKEYKGLIDINALPVMVTFENRLTAIDLTSSYKKLTNEDNSMTITDISRAFELCVLFHIIERGQNWYDTKDVITLYKDYLGIDLSKLAGVDESLVFKELNGKSCTIGTINSAYLSAIQKALDTANTNNTNSPYAGNKGGGGSFGGGVSVSTDYIQNLPNNEAAEDILFPDVKSFAPWAYQSIEALHGKGIVSGRGDGSFDPQSSITREEFTKLVVLMSNIVPLYENSGFYDVDENEWYSPYVAAARKAGLITGINDTTFGASQTISRQDMAVIIYRAIIGLGFSENDEEIWFSDADDISDYAKNPIAALTAAKIINGKGNNLFEPMSNTTRAESAHLIYAAMTSLGLQ